MNRNTVQKELVLSAVLNLHGHVTAEDVYNYIKKDHPTVGRGTVYRNLNILSSDKQIRRVEIPNGPDRYDFTLKDHYHVRCVRCGCVEDADIEVFPDLVSKVGDSHGFKVFSYDILFNGLCSRCQATVHEEL